MGKKPIISAEPPVKFKWYVLMVRHSHFTQDAAGKLSKFSFAIICNRSISISLPYWE